MKPWSRRTSLLAGVALIALTNAVALGGVAWNRSGESESRLQLSMRELRVTRGDFNRESNGVMLNLAWRSPVRDDKELSVWSSSGGGQPPWLNEAKMVELGFVKPDETVYADLPRRRGTSRDVLIVLELDGPARQAHGERVRARVDELMAKAATQEGEAAKRSIKQAQEWLQKEESELSHLFAVDAGTDLNVLRQRYPDRARYAIVQGTIASAFDRVGNAFEMRGYLKDLSADTLNVPYEHRSQLTAADNGRSPRDNARDELKGAAVTVAFGRRLEPWIIAINRADAR